MEQEEKILHYFSVLKEEGTIGSAYLFIGQNAELINSIIKIIDCRESVRFCDACWDCTRIAAHNHPDLFLVSPDPLTVKIEQIRQAQYFLSLKSFRAQRKVVIIQQAEELTYEAQGAFLKTLEEPPKNSFIALCVSKNDGILPTVLSRVRKIYLPVRESPIDKHYPESVFEFLRGSKLEFKNREDLSCFLWTLIVMIRDTLVYKVSLQNNRLLKTDNYGIILKSLGVEELMCLLNDVFKIYNAYTTVNENLALNLLRLRLHCTEGI